MMMTCDEVRMSLGVYVLGALEPDECVLVEAHLAGCADCRAEFEELTGVAAFLGKVSQDDVAQVASPPQAVLDRLLSAKVKRRRMTRLVLSLAASVLVAGFGGTLWVANQSTQGGSSASAPHSVAEESHDSFSAQEKAVPSASPAPEADARIMRDVPEDLEVTGGEKGSVRATVTASAGESGTTVKVVLSGVAQGTRFRLDVIGLGGVRETAGNWIVDKAAYDESGAFTATTTIPPGGISSFEIATAGGRVLLTIPVR